MALKLLSLYLSSQKKIIAPVPSMQKTMTIFTNPAGSLYSALLLTLSHFPECVDKPSSILKDVVLLPTSLISSFQMITTTMPYKYIIENGNQL
jgi:hypothetical protein